MSFENLRYKFVSKEVETIEMVRGKIKKFKAINIGVLDLETGIEYPHPLSHFIKAEYEFMGRSINTQSAPANTICRFLNYLQEKVISEDEEFIDLKDLGIRGLKRIHGSRYITSLSLNGLQKNTVEQYEKYINKFFLYLRKMNYLNEKFEIEARVNSKGQTITKSLFRTPTLPTRFPSKETSKSRPAKLKDFGENRRELIVQFIIIARNIAPDIALGLCLQFYGGLRRGEVVNVSRGDLNINYREMMVVNIRDNRKEFFSHLKDTKFENPKRLNYLSVDLAKQTILDNDLVWEVYDDHMKMLDIMIRNKKIKNPSALFVDKSGNPMSGKVYERRFSKVKKAFLLSLIGHKDFYTFDTSIWGTHIGRGVFTNLLIDMGFTVTQLAIARGDRNINSALDYIDATLTNQQIKEAINEFKNYPEERLGIINIEKAKKLWKKGVIRSGR
ncbi:site-specific integrase [Gottfriedia acidiceleris]|uniref:site-specific integrase n=1 Tax=Gottfriedia acidiceleris TaxID=371036 RepID=UPI00101DD03B|nr:site-specific integrase [Gottfriedia acidiceleris]